MKVEEVKAYIESGILELYVLGDVTPAERLEVEAMAVKYPAVKDELAAIEKSLELYAKANELEPDDSRRENILNSLAYNSDESKISGPVNEARVLPIVKAQSNFYKYAFAASLALLIASVIALLNVYGRLKESTNLVASLQNQNHEIASTVSLKDGEIEVLRDPSFKLLKLQGTKISPAAAITVAWSPLKKKVWIDMATAKMPSNDKEHQYQLWALVAGKPVDLGVFDSDTTSRDMKEMKSITLADAFAVTLEKRGGSPTPTMDEMMVIGKF